MPRVSARAIVGLFRGKQRRMTEWKAKSDGDFIIKYRTRSSFPCRFVAVEQCFNFDQKFASAMKICSSKLQNSVQVLTSSGFYFC